MINKQIKTIIVKDEKGNIVEKYERYTGLSNIISGKMWIDKIANKLCYDHQIRANLYTKPFHDYLYQ